MKSRSRKKKRQALRSPEGGRVTTSTKEEPKAMPKATDTLAILEQSSDMVVWECGHTYAAMFTVDFYGRVSKMTDAFYKKRPYCGDCLIVKIKEDTIRCGLCGFAILPGERVAAYSDDIKAFPRRDRITLHEGNVIGCMGWDCCPSGGFLFGTWTGTEIQPLFGGNSMAGATFQSGKVIIV